MLREELTARLATEYRYAATKMEQEEKLPRKLFHFSVVFSEAQRIVNWQWDREIVILQAVAQQAHAQVTLLLRDPFLVATLPIDVKVLFEQLTKVTQDIASYFENAKEGGNRDEFFALIGRLAEISYSAGGNGAYLHEKGVIKF